MQCQYNKEGPAEMDKAIDDRTKTVVTISVI